MATERTKHGKWAEQQRQALIDAGVNSLDAQQRVDWILAHVGDNDPATWIPTPDELVQELDDTLTTDANAAFMASDATTTRYKRLLSAKLEDEQ